MLLKQFVNSILFSVVILLLSGNIMKADVLVETDSTIYGRVTQITETDILIARKCNSADIKTIPKSRVRFYQADSSCEPHSFTLPTSPLQFCDQEKQNFYKVSFNHEENEIYAIDVQLRKDGTIFIILANNLGTLQGSFKKIKFITPAQVCPKAIPPDFNIPKEFCHESPKIAINFNLTPVYNNQIFTRSFTFYLEVIGGTASEDEANDISRAFGTALTGWTSTLLALKTQLSPPLSEYLSSIVHTSGSGAIMLVPPQVTQVDCRENASVIVKLYKERNTVLFPVDGGYVAQAQTEGRTLMN
jgi:hypothetical protein